MERLKKLIKALINRETITYVIFGALTTVVSFVSFKLFDVAFHGKYYLFSNTISWILAVIFAYVTNKLFVFESKSWAFSVLKTEIPSFLSARIASYFIEQLGMFLLVTVLGFDNRVFSFVILSLSGKMTAKAIVSVLVVIINYVLSKFFIFKKSEKDNTVKSNSQPN